MAKLQRLRIQGDDLIQLGVVCVEHHAEEKAARREHRAVEVIALESVLRDESVVPRGLSGAKQLRIGAAENRVIVGRDHAAADANNEA
eukprot:scaffold33548_cov46-Phaeocystis_antarctica.AAC.3